MADVVEALLLGLQCVVVSNRGRSDSRKRKMKKIRQKRWKLLAVTMSVVLTMFSDYALRNPKQLWMLPRSSNWWEGIVLNNFGQHDWMQNFRMSKESFHYLCDQLRGVLEKQTTRLRKPLTVEQRVAITLWILATTSEYRTVAHLFDVRYA